MRRVNKAYFHTQMLKLFAGIALSTEQHKTVITKQHSVSIHNYYSQKTSFSICSMKYIV